MDQGGNRQKALENQIGRIQRRIAVLEARNLRFSWYRLGIIVSGGIFTWVAATRLGENWALWTALFFLVGLIFVASIHRQLRHWKDQWILYLAIKEGHLARLKLQWDHIPPSLPVTGKPKSTLEMDLDLTGRHSLHQLIDLTISREGGQQLADWLAQSEPELTKIASRQAIVQDLIPLVAFRDKLLLTFKAASKEPLEGLQLLRWLEDEIPSGKLRWMLPVSIFWVAVNLTLFLLDIFGQLPPYWIIPLSLYAAFYFFNDSDFEEFFEAIVYLDSQLDKFRSVLRFLENYPLSGKRNLSNLLSPLREPDRSPSVQLRKVKLATAGAGLRMNPVTGLFLNLILPWDFFFAYLVATYRAEVALRLPDWLETLYQLEALISLGNFAYLNPGYTFPQLDPESTPVFQTRELGHPLIPPQEKVSNDFTVNDLGEITIITGSNMAGKSTFIKTIGINLCLAYAGGPVNARYFRASPFRMHSCIRISDSITDGFSYFYAEVICLKKLLERLDSEGWPVLYLIDEIFRGTNNRERLVGSRAYLRFLVGYQGVGFLATHDLELAGLADESPKISNYHFRDQVQDGKLVFDYQIRPGPSPTTNALKIMQMEGLPVD